MPRGASSIKKDDKELDSILKSNELTAKQEAALLARCVPEKGQAPAFASPVNRIREESMLAGLGVISPDEIGKSALSK